MIDISDEERYEVAKNTIEIMKHIPSANKDIGYFDSSFSGRLATIMLIASKIFMAPIYFMDRAVAAFSIFRPVILFAYFSAIAAGFYLLTTTLLLPTYSKESAFMIYSIVTWIYLLAMCVIMST